MTKIKQIWALLDSYEHQASLQYSAQYKQCLRLALEALEKYGGGMYWSNHGFLAGQRVEGSYVPAHDTQLAQQTIEAVAKELGITDGE